MTFSERTSDSERLALASDILLAPAQLGTDQLQSLLGGKLAGRADYADVYFQHSRHEAWILEDGLVRDASFNLERGAGVRLVSGDKTGFAYSDDISLDASPRRAAPPPPSAARARINRCASARPRPCPPVTRRWTRCPAGAAK